MSRTTDPHPLEDEAAQALARGDRQRAIEAYTRGAELEPDAPRWLLRVAEVHATGGETTLAVAALHRAAMAYAHADDVLKAVAACRVALRLAPDDPAIAQLLDALTAHEPAAARASEPEPGDSGADADASAPEITLGDEARVTLDQLGIGQRLQAHGVPGAAAGVLEVDLHLHGGGSDLDAGYEDLSLDESELTAPAPPVPPRPVLPAVAPAARPAVSAVAPRATSASRVRMPGAPAPASVAAPASEPVVPRPPPVDPARLHQIPLLGPLPPEALETFIRRVDYETAAPGDRVISEGEVADKVYLVVRGDLVATRSQPPRPLARLGEGAFFGEMALLDDTPRSASVVAVTDVELLVLRRQLVLEICERYPSVLATLMQSLRARLIATLTSTSPLFSPIPPRERTQIVGRFRLREIDAGTTFIREGARADGLYVMLTGRADVVAAGFPLATLTTGDVAGEMSLLGRGLALASVTARSRVTALVLPAVELQEIIMVHPQILEHLATLSEARRTELEHARTAGTYTQRSVRGV